MPDTGEEKQLRDKMHHIESLLRDVEQFRDPHAKAKTREIVQSLMDLHGAVLSRMLDHVASSSHSGVALIDHMAGDKLISSLLLLYGLHPLDLETRVRQALDKVRPYLHSHGGNVELLGVDDGIIRLSLQGSCHGCPSSAATLKSTIEEAITEMAPDAMGLEVEGEVPAEVVASNHHHDFSLPILTG